MPHTETPRTIEDLCEYLAAIELCYFGNALEGVRIEWARWRPGNWGEHLGSYTFRGGAGVIRISKRLAHRWVPDFFVLHVVYHEALHHVHGPAHDLRFHEAERRFFWHAQAAVWEHENAARLACDPPPGVSNAR